VITPEQVKKVICLFAKYRAMSEDQIGSLSPDLLETFAAYINHVEEIQNEG
jgi:hypothetical protein